MSEAHHHQEAPSIPFEDLPERMKRSRHRMGWDQADIANYLGVHQRTVANYETGKTEPKRALLMSWANLTNVPLDWLILGITPEARCPHCDQATLPPQQGRRGADTQSRCLSTSAQVGGLTPAMAVGENVVYPDFDRVCNELDAADVATDGAEVFTFPTLPLDA